MIFNHKVDIDKYMEANWTFTPVQYDGIRFEHPANGRWISLQLVPYDSIDEAIGTGVQTDRGTLLVRCYGRSATESFKLANGITEFISNKEIAGAVYDRGKGDGLGAVSLENDIYQTVVMFDIIMHSANC